MLNTLWQQFTGRIKPNHTPHTLAVNASTSHRTTSPQGHSRIMSPRPQSPPMTSPFARHQATTVPTTPTAAGFTMGAGNGGLLRGAEPFTSPTLGRQQQQYHTQLQSPRQQQQLPLPPISPSPFHRHNTTATAVHLPLHPRGGHSAKHAITSASVINDQGHTMSLFKQSSRSMEDMLSLAREARRAVQDSLASHMAQHYGQRNMYATSTVRFVPVQPYGIEGTDTAWSGQDRPPPPNRLVTQMCWSHKQDLDQRINFQNHNDLISTFYWAATEAHCTPHLPKPGKPVELPPQLPMTTLLSEKRDVGLDIGPHLRIGSLLATQTCVIREAVLTIGPVSEPCVVKIVPIFSIPQLHASNLKHNVYPLHQAQVLSVADVISYLYHIMVEPMPKPPSANPAIPYPSHVWSMNQAFMECYAYASCAQEFFWGNIICRNSEQPGEMYMLLILPRFEKTLDHWFKEVLEAHDHRGREMYKSVGNLVPSNLNTDYFVKRLLQSLAQLFFVTLPQLKRHSGFCHLDAKLDNIAVIRLEPCVADKVFQTQVLFDTPASVAIDGTIHIPANGKRIQMFDFGYAFLVDCHGVGWLSRTSHDCHFGSMLNYNNTAADIVQICLSILQSLVRQWPTAMQRLIAQLLNLEPFPFTKPQQVDPRILLEDTQVKESGPRFEASAKFSYTSWKPLVSVMLQIITLSEHPHASHHHSQYASTSSSYSTIVRFDPYVWGKTMYTLPTQAFDASKTWYGAIFNILAIPDTIDQSCHPDDENANLVEMTLPFRPRALAQGAPSVS